MLEVLEIEPGVFQVTVTDMHRDCLYSTSEKMEICSEAMLGLWVAAGMNELAGFDGG